MTWTTNAAATNAVDYRTVAIAQLMSLKKSDLSEPDQIIVRDRLLTEQQEQSKFVKAYTESERLLRAAVVAFNGDPNKDKGTENVPLGNGYKLKIVKSITYSFVKNEEGKQDKAALERALRDIEKMENGTLIAERLIKFEPKLSESEYKLLTPEAKAIIDKVIVTKPGSATVEVIAPKGN